MLFSFDKLVTKCIHNPFFTNCLVSEKLRSVFSLAHKTFKRYSTYSLSEIKSIDRHFRYISEKEKKNLVERVLKRLWSKKSIGLIINPDLELCQMSLDGKEGRMIGILEKINNSQKRPKRNYLFSPLVYDFEHTFHPNLRKKRIKNNDLVCIMTEKDCN